MPTSPLRLPHLIALGLGLLAGLVVFALVQSGKPPGQVSGIAPLVPVIAPPPPGPQVVFSASPQEPAASPDLLPAGVARIHAFYNLPDMGPGEVPTAIWRKDGKPLGDAASQVQADPRRSGHGTIVLDAPGGKLAPGMYELQLKTQKRTFGASFAAAWGATEILAQPAPAEAVLTIPQSGTARAVGAQGEMRQPANAFTPADKVYFVMRYTGAEPGTAVTIAWWGGKTELAQARQEVTLLAAAGWAHAWMQVEQGLPRGAYRVTAVVSGGAQELATAEFSIQ